MYSYIFKEHVFVLDPFNFKSSEINTQWDIRPNYHYLKATYPNGFVFESITYKDKIVVKPNKQLINNGNGTLSVII